MTIAYVGSEPNTMTHIELILAEVKARQDGNIKEANRLQALRWGRAMGSVINSENTKRREV